LNHPKTSDQQRRDTEAKLLERRKSRLWSTPSETPDKSHLRDEVIDMVTGIVLLRIPNDLAWTLYFEMQNHDTLRKPHCISAKKPLISFSNRDI
jgi:superkiller protein 3